jgi:Na+-driven multidrug efflux pump
LIGVAVSTAIFPSIAASDDIGMKNQIGEGLRLLIPIILPLIAGIMILAEPVIRILFNEESIQFGRYHMDGASTAHICCLADVGKFWNYSAERVLCQKEDRYTSYHRCDICRSE